MLHDGTVGAVDNGVVLGVLQQDAYDGGLGDIGVQLIGHPAVFRGVQHIPGEAGAIVVIGGQQAVLLQLGRQIDCRPGGQIAALAVAADTQGQGGAEDAISTA